MRELLEKSRRISRFVQESQGPALSLKELAEVLCEEVGANIYIVSRRGKLLGFATMDEFECDVVAWLTGNGAAFPKECMDWLLRIIEASENLRQDEGKCFLNADSKCPFGEAVITVVPVYAGGDRLATLVMARFEPEFEEDELVLAEFAATIIGMEVLRSKADRIEEEARKQAAVQMAFDTLSFSEQEAVEHIFRELNGDEGLLVASKIADKVGITRSVIVNALRKFESAGVIESRSLGMKGTYIRVLNDKLFDELERLRTR
ncbi:MAG: GTP-sensing pleiotropic transcriptional regulator CodY [Bacillota bacterium]|nr:GTP-sensing pleiotropic transcriptional regulator CodY [Bacillota bacterium]MDI9414573.1 GTP-sensing pleiotropic transcriptional regulator CodY [Bacillota bacterium]NLD13351.1 GTP-sensing pleiotropic transcriptional regulator CodY [Bacillota bacterium]HAV21064.1 GTP-sensing pleiotropic transcriptional regulator CodY [Bacillota bacterium]HOB88272.1 GTP-sensing pleiotropic transcriptional regulator CodY [Bacillota bacterium]